MGLRPRGEFPALSGPGGPCPSDPSSLPLPQGCDLSSVPRWRLSKRRFYSDRAAFPAFLRRHAFGAQPGVPMIFSAFFWKPCSFQLRVVRCDCLGSLCPRWGVRAESVEGASRRRQCGESVCPRWVACVLTQRCISKQRRTSGDSQWGCGRAEPRPSGLRPSCSARGCLPPGPPGLSGVGWVVPSTLGSPALSIADLAAWDGAARESPGRPAPGSPSVASAPKLQARLLHGHRTAGPHCPAPPFPVRLREPPRLPLLASPSTSLLLGRWRGVNVSKYLDFRPIRQ